MFTIDSVDPQTLPKVKYLNHDFENEYWYELQGNMCPSQSTKTYWLEPLCYRPEEVSDLRDIPTMGWFMVSVLRKQG
jgi:hypothetical protein